jgi:opacity protein-like surface antigen
MLKLRSFTVALISLLAAAPAKAQLKESPDDFFKDVLGALFKPNWNAFINTGFSNFGRFVMQAPVTPLGGQRSLQSSDGYMAGIGGGVDLLMRMGARFSYTYNSGQLNFRTDDGNGSDALDIDDVGQIHSNNLTLELMRYMLTSRSTVSPYGTVGLVGTWWHLDDHGGEFVEAAGGSTQFRYGALVSFGVQYNPSNKFGIRAEWASASIRNPWTGKHSFVALGAPTINEPGRVEQSDWRIVGVYNFGKREPPPPATTAKKN